MPTTPRRNNRNSYSHNRQDVSTTPQSQKKRLDGLWKDGHWWCNCEPREKAVLREVKKNTPRKGKLFWTCSVYPYCRFFLWRDDALARETGPPAASTTVTLASTSPASSAASSQTQAADEQVPRPKTPTFTQRSLKSFGGFQVSPPRTGEESRGEDGGSPNDMDATPCPASSKRKRNVLASDELDEMDSDEERHLAHLADNSAKKLSNQAVSSLATTTPTPTTATINGLPTPTVSRTLFPSDARRPKTVSFDDTNLTTPSKLPNPVSSSPPDTDLDVTHEVLSLLHDQKIDKHVLQSIEHTLTISARKANGIAMGRDSVRTALRERDEKIARLQQRITALENKERMYEGQLSSIKANLMKIHEDN